MKKKYSFINSIVFGMLVAFGLFAACSGTYHMNNYKSVAEAPTLDPDYTDLVIPPNIAPLDFTIQEAGKKFMVKIFADSKDTIRVSSASPNIKIPLKAWQDFLARSAGKTIYFDVFAYTPDNEWVKFKRVKNQVADEPIDRYLVYRFLRPNYTVQKEMNIRQRDLTSYDETLLMTTKTIAACINCHSFNQNNPSDMLFHIRWGKASGTMLAQNGHITKVDTRTEFNQSPGAYPSWHPSGKLVAFSVNKVFQFFHANIASRDVIDLSSDLILYHTESNTVSIDPKISSPDFMETWPTWSPDGRFLYFCRTPQLAADFNLEDEFRHIKYDLVRVAYDPATDTFGDLETLISAADIDKSCSQPRVSPDGKYLMFSVTEYGNFPIFNPTSDLYMMNLGTKEFQHLNINSEAPEGFHCWSTNSHWIVFTSKRDNGIFTRLYFTYVDENGAVHKPFVLPQKDPEDYQTIFKSFSVPELIVEPVPYTPQRFIDVALDSARMQKAHLASDTEMLPTAPVDSSRAATDYP